MPKIQAEQSVNSLGKAIIPRLAIEELLVNALIHRDYLISAPIRILALSDRIEIISPGHLPNHLTVEKIIKGNSNIRNPILTSFVAKNVLPYRGLGSGIRRALELWPQITFIDDREGNLFTVIIHFSRINDPVHTSSDPVNTSSDPVNTSSDPVKADHEIHTLDHILDALKNDPALSYDALAEKLGLSRSGIKRHIKTLRDGQRIKRIGSDKNGTWDVRPSP